MMQLLEHYNAFEQMVLHTTMLANNPVPMALRDSTAIIRFIADAFGWQEELTVKAVFVLTEELTDMNVLSDRSALYLLNTTPGEKAKLDEDKFVLYDVKAKAIKRLADMGQNYLGSMGNPFDYDHLNEYNPYMRFHEMVELASLGNLLACRMVGIMLALGIGVQQDLPAAVVRFRQATYWGDLPSTYYLALCLVRLKDDDADVAVSLRDLMARNLRSCVTMLPEEEKTDRSAVSLFQLISSIRQDIVNGKRHEPIDYSFVEVMMLPNLSYARKMEYVNLYPGGDWREETNSRTSGAAFIGFNKDVK